VVAEGKDKAALALYCHYESTPLIDQPRKVFIAGATIRQAFR